jgi:HD-GYP domain-containing protein (c-di-GMP phosphodiesterase class II)
MKILQRLESVLRQLTIIRERAAAPLDLYSQLSGNFEVDCASIEDIDSAKPGQYTLLDVDLSVSTLLIKLKDWLKNKPRDAAVVFAIDKSSLLQNMRASALGATAVVHRPFNGRDLERALSRNDRAPQSEISALRQLNAQFLVNAAPAIKDATECLEDIFLAACAGEPVEPMVLASAGDAISRGVEELGFTQWIETVRAHHSQTYQHCLLVTGAIAGFGQHLGFSRTDCQRLSIAGMLHDIGKARIPIAVLEKPGPLTREEREVMKNHPEYGYAALVGNDNISPEMLDMVVHHHEYLDGSGYPHGLKGSQISDVVRIMTICDVFGALIERRSYKEPMSNEAAYQILRDMGGRLDQDFVRAFGPVALCDAKQDRHVPA